MKKILQIIPSLRRNGTERYIINNLKFINKNEFNFDFYVIYDDSREYYDEINNNGGNIFYSSIGLRERDSYKLMKEIIYIIKKNGPYDAVHSHLNLHNAWILMASKFAGVKTTISHGHMILNRAKTNKGRLYQLLKRSINNKFSDYKIACTNLVGNTLYSKKVFDKKGLVFKNGIDITKWKNFHDKEIDIYYDKYNFSKDSFILGNISRFDKNKNQDFILIIFSEILKKIPDSILILGGTDGGELKNIIDKSSKMNIHEKIRFIGERNDVELWMNLIDIFVFPSKQEGFGLVLIESQASSTPCVVSDVVPKETDMKIDLIRYLSLNQTAEFWAEEIIKLKKMSLYDKKFVHEMIVKNGYSLTDTVKELEVLYSK